METTGLIAFLTEHQTAVPFIAAALAAVETIAFLSIFVPSTALLMAVGAASSTGAFLLGPIWVGATIGALIGSSFSYWLGWAFGARMLAAWPLRDHVDAVTRTKALFARWGGLAIVAGHFIGPLRPVVFLFAGLSRMRFWAFMAFNVAGAASWAYLIPKSGAVGGDILGWLWRALGF
jgi:membrane protein DedA with SNARE-associated domain